jgi:hypothetical protein
MALFIFLCLIHSTLREFADTFIPIPAKCGNVREHIWDRLRRECEPEKEQCVPLLMGHMDWHTMTREECEVAVWHVIPIEFHCRLHECMVSHSTLCTLAGASVCLVCRFFLVKFGVMAERDFVPLENILEMVLKSIIVGPFWLFGAFFYVFISFLYVAVPLIVLSNLFMEYIWHLSVINIPLISLLLIGTFFVPRQLYHIILNCYLYVPRYHLYPISIEVVLKPYELMRELYVEPGRTTFFTFGF